MYILMVIRKVSNYSEDIFQRIDVLKCLIPVLLGTWLHFIMCCLVKMRALYTAYVVGV